MFETFNRDTCLESGVAPELWAGYKGWAGACSRRYVTPMGRGPARRGGLRPHDTPARDLREGVTSLTSRVRVLSGPKKTPPARRFFRGKGRLTPGPSTSSRLPCGVQCLAQPSRRLRCFDERPPSGVGTQLFGRGVAPAVSLSMKKKSDNKTLRVGCLVCHFAFRLGHAGQSSVSSRGRRKNRSSVLRWHPCASPGFGLGVPLRECSLHLEFVSARREPCSPRSRDRITKNLRIGRNSMVLAKVCVF